MALCARINGLVVDLDDAPALDKNKKHTIEAVVDRVRVKDDIAQRLAESSETALNLSDGVAQVVDMDDAELPATVFSARLPAQVAATHTELEPRMFSFKTLPAHVPAVMVWGSLSFDPELVVADDNLTLAEGAIRGWDRRNVYYFHMLNSIAQHCEFDVEVPFKQLGKKHRDIILNGSGRQRIDFSYVNDRGDVVKRTHRFEGVLPNMARRFQETESSMVRENLQKFMRVTNCPSCSGTRLREESRHVFVGKSNLPSITQQSIAQTWMFQRRLKGQRATIGKNLKKSGASAISCRRGLKLSLGKRRNPFWRRSATHRLASQIGAGLVGVLYILDEPSIGLHQRDNERLLRTLEHLRDLGNTVIVVEHDEEAMRKADYLVDIGPGAVPWRQNRCCRQLRGRP